MSALEAGERSGYVRPAGVPSEAGHVGLGRALLERLTPADGSTETNSSVIVVMMVKGMVMVVVVRGMDGGWKREGERIRQKEEKWIPRRTRTSFSC